MKTSLIIFTILVFTMMLPYVQIKILSYITLVIIFFPIYIPFMGNDALTTGTACILLLYLKYVTICIRDQIFFRDKFDFIIYLLIFSAGCSTILAYWFGHIGNNQIGMAIRQYFSFLSALLFFIVIKYDNNDTLNNKNNHCETLFFLYATLVSIHIIIAIMVKFFPETGFLFKIFLSRNIELYEINLVGSSHISRLRSFIFSYEYFGEFLALFVPIIIYKIIYFKNSLWIIFLLLFTISEIYSVTRSGIVLFVIGSFLSFSYFFKDRMFKNIFLLYIISIVFISFYIFYSSLYHDVIFRFHDSFTTWEKTKDINLTINRGGFTNIWGNILSNLNFFGYSLVRIDYHNLFMTTLHQLGIIGSIFFFSVLFCPLFKLFISFNSKNHHSNKPLIFACILSLLLFMINEFKVEFTRRSSYQQLCWGLFAVYYIIATKNNAERIES